jgi:acyl dehydratase
VVWLSASESDVDEFALMSHDHNPLHTSRDFVAGTPFEVTVPHGALIVRKTLNTLKLRPGVVSVAVLKFELPLI